MLTNVDTMQIWCVRWLGSLVQVQSLQTLAQAIRAITDSLATKPDLIPTNSSTQKHQY